MKGGCKELVESVSFPFGCGELFVIMGREEPVVFALKNLQKCFGLSLTELARDEIYSRFFDLIMDFMLRRKSRNRFQRDGELANFALFLIVSFLLRA